MRVRLPTQQYVVRVANDDRPKPLRSRAILSERDRMTLACTVDRLEYIPQSLPLKLIDEPGKS